ncbi:hypothetical protein ACJJH9_17025 [Microbulbifer sp. DLAB2-AF]|uniref:hypothetical protein n=1 Tax=Microbulbifer sp. DLAB2-AF TaxID=3243395 RepID=UPI004039D3AB
MELQQLVTKSLGNYIDSGKLEKSIDSKVEATIVGILDSVLREYSDFGKSLKKAIEDKISICTKQITLPEYNKYITDMIGELYIKALHDQADAHLKPLLDEALNPVPSVMTSKEFLELIKEEWQEQHLRNEHEEIILEWKRSEHFIDVKILHGEYSFNNVEITLYKDRDEEHHYISIIREDGKNFRRGIQAQTANYGLPGELFKLYARRTLITDIDEVYGDSIYLDYD